MGVSYLSQAAGGEKTSTGRLISNVGSGVLSTSLIGSQIGSVFGPLGTAVGGAVGALGGLVLGLNNAKKAGEEYAQAQRIQASELASEKSGKALQEYFQKNTVASRAEALSSLKALSTAETATGIGVTRQRASAFGQAIGYTNETQEQFYERTAKTQMAGAEQAQSFLANEMMKSGKTFDEISKILKPEDFKLLTQNIAEADLEYIRLQKQRAATIAEYTTRGDLDAASKLQKQTDTELDALRVSISKSKTAQDSQAAQAAALAAAAQKSAILLEKSILDLEKVFDTVAQVFNRTSFEMDELGNRAKDIISGTFTSRGMNLQRDINILQNPNAYTEQERKGATTRNTSLMGPIGGFVA